MTLNVNEAVKDIKKGIKKFGEYSYYDEGASAVMDIDKWVSALSALPPVEAREFLLQVEAHPYEHTELFVQSCVSNLDGQPDDWWDEFIVGLEQYY